MQDSAIARTAPAAQESLAARYRRIRAATRALCEGLSAEDMGAQSMADASPTKWHLAHVSWFFDEFVLKPAQLALQPGWGALFNSYYQSLGQPYARPARGLLTRPSLGEVLDYGHGVDRRLLSLLETPGETLAERVSLGLEHEQQHQELILTDLQHLFAQNPLEPAYRPGRPSSGAAPPWHWLPGRSGLVEIGASATGFAFDNERPRHQVLLYPYELASRLVTNGEYLEFIRDGGYRQPMLWLSEGWNCVSERGWTRPLYWDAELASQFTLRGRIPLDPHAPVCHLSFHEATAFAHWAGARLPTEAEWEAVAGGLPVAGNLQEHHEWHPVPAGPDAAGPLQMFGDVWEWTASPYVGYPGFRPLPGTLAEYNAKFMCGQWVLRGGSCLTPAAHLRASYRNFFYAPDRWQCSGLRLARDA